MSTSPTPTPAPAATAPSTVQKILNAIGSVNGELALGLQVGEAVIPLIKGVVTSIKNEITGGSTVNFTVELTAEQTALDAIVSTADADLVLINAELARMGLPQLVVPPAADPSKMPPVPPPGTVQPVGPEPASGGGTTGATGGTIASGS